MGPAGASAFSTVGGPAFGTSAWPKYMLSAFFIGRPPAPAMGTVPAPGYFGARHAETGCGSSGTVLHQAPHEDAPRAIRPTPEVYYGSAASLSLSLSGSSHIPFYAMGAADKGQGSGKGQGTVTWIRQGAPTYADMQPQSGNASPTSFIFCC
jgi:hypothetical protein